MISSDEQDILKGREVLMYYHNAALNAGGGYPAKNIDELARLISPKNPNEAFRAAGLMANTLIMDNSGFQMYHVRDAMYSLAKEAAGRIPDTNTISRKIVAITQDGPGIAQTFMSVGSQSVSQIASGAVKVGESVMATGSSLLTVMPLVLTLGAIAYVYLFITKRS